LIFQALLEMSAASVVGSKAKLRLLH
jgi:hypothetical protein